MFAVDGCKMSSNASKEWSGAKEELRHKKDKMERAIKQILARHPDRTEARQVYFFQGRDETKPETLSACTHRQTFAQKMKRKIDSIKGRLTCLRVHASRYITEDSA